MADASRCSIGVVQCSIQPRQGYANIKGKYGDHSARSDPQSLALTTSSEAFLQQNKVQFMRVANIHPNKTVIVVHLLRQHMVLSHRQFDAEDANDGCRCHDTVTSLQIATLWRHLAEVGRADPKYRSLVVVEL